MQYASSIELIRQSHTRVAHAYITIILFAPLAVHVHAGCSTFPFYIPTKLLLRFHTKCKTILCPILYHFFYIFDIYNNYKNKQYFQYLVFSWNREYFHYSMNIPKLNSFLKCLRFTITSWSDPTFLSDFQGLPKLWL